MASDPSTRHDVIIIGGSFAGLSAALYLGRARRDVCVVDAGLPRNRFAAHAHGVFGHDGSAPAAILEAARAQVAAYPTVGLVQSTVDDAAGERGDFTVTLSDGSRRRASYLLLAYGVSDPLPDIPGVAERWGRSVLHCPYCHGYEFAGQRLGVINPSPMAAHQAMLIAEWGPTTLFLNGENPPPPEELEELARRGVAVEAARVGSLRGEGADLSAVALEDGRTIPVEALYLGIRTRPNSDLAVRLRCAVEDGMAGDVIVTDDLQQTSVPGVFAAGDIARGMHSATGASADGMVAGTAIHRELVFPDVGQGPP